MKGYIKIILSVVSKLMSFLLFTRAGKGNSVTLPALFYKSSFSVKGNNHHLSVTGVVEKSDFFLEGTANTVQLGNAGVHESIITVSGNNNRILFEEGVILRKSVITVRGNGCVVAIGKDSTFGGVRIISAGENNSITIGAGCLFADFIEVWASDTHPIYNEQKQVINPEKPIVIGNKVWVDARATILKGVTIASGSVVGMGSLVINDVPESSVTVGSPNRIVKSNVSWSLHY